MTEGSGSPFGGPVVGLAGGGTVPGATPPWLSLCLCRWRDLACEFASCCRLLVLAAAASCL